MADSMLSLNGAASLNSGAIGAARAGQQVSKAVVERLLGSIEQAGRSSSQSSPNRIDRVQISQEGQQRLAAEQAQAG
jgi:hypothetical protein